MKVEENFGFLSRFSFLQDLGSFFIAKLNPAVIHNLAKYMALKNGWIAAEFIESRLPLSTKNNYMNYLRNLIKA